jgi:hypothetical protein
MRHFDRLLEGMYEIHSWYILSEKHVRHWYIICSPIGRFKQVPPWDYDHVLARLLTDRGYRQRIAEALRDEGSRSLWR